MGREVDLMQDKARRHSPLNMQDDVTVGLNFCSCSCFIPPLFCLVSLSGQKYIVLLEYTNPFPSLHVNVLVCSDWLLRHGGVAYGPLPQVSLELIHIFLYPLP